MSGTIELLEAIGSDASLRYAATEELMRVLERARASVELTEAVASGNAAPLRTKLNLWPATQVQQMHASWFGDDC